MLYTLHNNTAVYGPGVTEEKIHGLRAVRNSSSRAEILPDNPRAVLQFGKEAQISVFSEQPEIFAAIQPRIEASRF